MKKKYIYIILLIGVAFIIGGVLLYFNQNKVKSKNNDLEELDINSKQVQDLYNIIKYDTTATHNNSYLLTTDEVKNSDIEDNYKFEKSVHFLEAEDIVVNNTNCTVTIDKSKIDDKMKELFNNADYNIDEGYGIFLNITNATCGNATELSYQENSNQFTGNLVIIGGMDGFKNLYPTKLDSAYKNKKDNTILLKEKVLYLNESCENAEACDYEIYKNYDKTDKLGEEKNIKISDSYDFFKNYSDTARVVTYTFKYDNDHYYFYSSKFDK